MNWKTITLLVTVCLLGIPALAADRYTCSPVTDPHQFRNSLRHGFVDRTTDGPRDWHTTQIDVEHTRKAALADEAVLISESVGPANFTQKHADIVDLKGDRMVAAWEDDRLGATAIYIQILDDDGNPIDGNMSLLVEEEANLSDPVLCGDGTGHFFLVWRNEHNGYLEAARFDSLAQITTGRFWVSDTAAASYAGEFDAVCLSDGRLVAVWEDHALVNNIVFRAFSAGGVESIVQTTVNSDGLPVKHWSPAVAAGSGGTFVVVWEDYRNGTADIFFRRFNALGVASGPEFSLGDAGTSDSARYLPSITFSTADEYVAAWVDLRDGQNVYMQQIGSSGNPVGVNRLVTDETNGFSNWEIDLDFTPGGSLLAAWTLYGTSNSIMLQRYSTGLVKDGSPTGVSAPSEKISFDPDIAGNGNEHGGIAWTGADDGRIDVFGAVYGSGPTAVAEEFLINDDALGSPSVEPDVAAFSRFDWSIVFTDKRRDGGDIMLQQLYVGGDLIGANRRINADPPGGTQSQPAVAVANDKLLVSWTDIRNGGAGGQNIMCRFIRPQDDLSPEIVANDDGGDAVVHYGSDCALNVSDIGLVVWTDTRTGKPGIYGQLFESDFSKRGVNFLIGPSESSETGEAATVSADSAGDFVAAFLNRSYPSGPAVEFKKITGTGQISDLFVFVADVNEYQINGFDAGINGNDEIILVWNGLAAGETALYLTKFDYAGTVLIPSMAVTDHPDAMPEVPDVSVDNVGFTLITWMDHRTGSARPFRQVFDATMTPVEGNVPVAFDPGQYMRSPAVAGYRGRGLFVWSDGRSDGLNVYASQVLYEPTDADDSQDDIMPDILDLAQNYPNPFNPVTTIRFTLPHTGQVRLEIFNLLGQRIRTLVDRTVPAGSHEVVWDGTDGAGRQVASGVYLYRLTGGDDIRTRKMTLVK